jgi:acyl-coenzyme A thioesterase PaaI-like protein
VPLLSVSGCTGIDDEGGRHSGNDIGTTLSRCWLVHPDYGEVVANKSPDAEGAKPKTVVKDMTGLFGGAGLPILDAVGVSFDDYGVEDDDRAGWATARWAPTPLACDEKGVVASGVFAVVLDAAMSFAVSAGLSGKDRSGGALEIKTETMRSALCDEPLSVRGAVMRRAKQVAFAEARIEDAKGRLVSRSTGTFLIQRD